MPAQAEKKQQLVAAAEALLPDYAAGGELTAFTALESKDFDIVVDYVPGQFPLAPDPFDRLRTSAKSGAEGLDLAIQAEQK